MQQWSFVRQEVVSALETATHQLRCHATSGLTGDKRAQVDASTDSFIVVAEGQPIRQEVFSGPKAALTWENNDLNVDSSSVETGTSDASAPAPTR